MSDWSKRNARAILRELQPFGYAQGVRFRTFAGEDLRGQTFGAGEDLAGADFTGADLTDAGLVEALLRGATLTGCRLTGARLDRASLVGADLTGANLDGASLVGADLRGARLDGATFQRARLTGAMVSPGVRLEGWGAAGPHDPPQLHFPAPQERVRALAWHPGGDLLAVGRGRTVEVWDVGGGSVITSFLAYAGILSDLAWSPAGDRLVVAGSAGMTQWNPSGGVQLVAGGAVTALAWSPDGSRLASAGGGGVTLQTSPDDRAYLAFTIGRVDALSWSPDGTMLMANLVGGGPRLWHAASNTVERLNPGDGFTASTDGPPPAWSPDGSRLAVTAASRETVLWDPIARSPVGALPAFAGALSLPQAMAWSPDGALLAVSYLDGLALWDPRSGAETVRISGFAASAMAWSPDSSRLVAESEFDSDLFLLDRANPSSVTLVSEGSARTWERGRMKVAWSPDATRLAVAGVHGFACWDPGTCAPSYISTGSYEFGPVPDMAWPPDGRELMIAVAGVVERRDAQSMRSLAKPGPGVGGTVVEQAISSRGVLATRGDNGMVRISDSTDRPDVLLPYLVDHGSPLCWSPDGARLLVISSNSVTIWTPDGRRTTAAEPHPAGSVRSVAWSADGSHLAFGHWNNSVSVWDAGSLEVEALLQGHAAPVRALAWSPDDRCLATASTDGTVRCTPVGPPAQETRKPWWGRVGRRRPVVSVEQVGPVVHRVTSPAALAFSPDGKRLAVAETDGTVALVPVDPAVTGPVTRLLVTARGWAAFHGDHRYRLHGEPDGHFWWTAGLCRFEPGELDGHGVERLDTLP